MFRRLRLSSYLGNLVGNWGRVYAARALYSNLLTPLSCLLWFTLLTTPLVAHQVQLFDDVGGTTHIEPNDNPRAGEPSLTWFALTRKGGALIPLAACKCKLTLYAQPFQEGDEPIQELPLRAISAEGYEGIPATDITFPDVGAYELVLEGESKIAGDFQPFELKFAVTVVAGQAAPAAVANAPGASVSSPAEQLVSSPQQPDLGVSRQINSWQVTGVITGVVITAGSLGFLLNRRWKKK